MEIPRLPSFSSREPLPDSTSVALRTAAPLPLIPSSDFLVRVAEEVWRLERRVERAARTAGEEPLKSIRDSAMRLRDTLDSGRVRLEDHHGEPYHEGMRLDIVHVDGDPAPEQPLWIVETIKPTVLLDDHVLSAGQVILGTQAPEDARP